MGRTSTVLLLLGCVGLGLAGALLGEPRQSPAPRTTEPTESASLPRIRFPVVKPDVPEVEERRESRPPPEPVRRRSDPAFVRADLYVLREYVDMSGRFATIAVRILGELRLDPTSHRVEVLLRLDPLLVGNEVFGSTFLAARGTWRLEGDELVVDGLDLANGRKDVFEPRGGTKRWRVESAQGPGVIRAGPFTFERSVAR